MTQLSKDLAEEFADKADTIHALKQTDAHFRRLLEDNHALWKEIQAIQSGQRPAEDEAWETLEKQRLAILDQIGAAIARAEAEAGRAG